MVSTNAAGRTDAFSSPFPYRSANQRSVCGSERRSNAAIRSFRRQAETKRAQFASTRRRTRPLNSGARDCSRQSPRVSFDPLRLRIGCEGIPASPAMHSDCISAGDESLPGSPDGSLPYRPNGILGPSSIWGVLSSFLPCRSGDPVHLCRYTKRHGKTVSVP